MWVKFLACDAGNGFGCILKGFSAFFAGKRRSLGRVSPVVWKGCAEAGSVPCGRCRKELLRGGVRRLWFPGLPAVPGGSVPDGFMCGVYRLHRDLLPVAGRSAGRQLPLYNYDSECFIFDTMAESRTDTLPKPDVDFSSVLSL